MQHPHTPTTTKQRPARCTNCPCHQFPSDSSLTSAIQKEERTASLIDWLSGGQRLDDASSDDTNARKHTNRCTNRLRASILILNSIRDACRVYLLSSSGAATTVRDTSHDEDLPNKKRQQQKTIWEDSFPALSSAASTVTPTILFGRKKDDGDKRDAHKKKQSLSSANDKANGGVQVNQCKVKKKIKPVTVSSVVPSNTSSSAWGNSNVAVWGKQPTVNDATRVNNIASIPSRPTVVPERTLKCEIANIEEAKLNGLPADPATPKKQTPSSKVSANQIDTKEVEEQLTRLVNIYATIIKNQLAPYLLLEIHLLIRLVSISDDTETTSLSNDASLPFATLFHSHQTCINFASQTIMSIEPLLLNLGHETIKLLSSLESLCKYCPKLTQKMQSIVQANNTSLLSLDSEKYSLGGNTNTPHITLPFDPKVDSRHNYKSVDESRLFKEREGLRDAFLFQLRAFQDCRGRLMEEGVSSKIIGNIEIEAKKMMTGLGSGNVVWFVGFFCDLLLQVGLLPVGETDSDVLNQVADQKRLQKLHKRFTTRGSQNNKHSSSRKLSIDQNHTTANCGSSLSKQIFRGHQEFFALFLDAADSYKFNTLLKRRLAQLITEMTALNDTKGFCEQITKTMLLAKFLGLLVFGPGYNNCNGESTVAAAEVAITGVDKKPLMDLDIIIQEAWTGRRLVIVIPWVVEFLKMMKWDSASKKSKYYTEILTILWSINDYCVSTPLSGQSNLSTNLLLVSVQLASLFHDLVGIVNAWDLPAISLPQQITVDDSSKSNAKFSPLDTLPLWFSKTYLFMTTTYFQDLFELVSHLQSAGINSSKPGASSTKKIRPRPISSGPLKDFVESNSFQKISPLRSSFSSPMSSPWSSAKTLSANPGSKAATKDRLIDFFFHQHQELQRLCETTIDSAIKNFAQSTLQGCVTPIFKENATAYEDFFSRSPIMEVNEYIELLQSLDVRANLKAREEMNNQFSRIIRDALELLSPPETQPKVREIACSLTLQHASRKGDQIIRSFIREEKKNLVDEFIRKERKVKAGVPLIAINRNKADKAEAVSSSVHSRDVDSIVDLTNLLGKINANNEVDSQLLDDLGRATEEVNNDLQKYCIGNDRLSCVEDFQTKLLALFDKFFTSSEAPSSLLCALFKASDVLCLLGKMGYLDTAASREFEQNIQDSNKLKGVVETALKYSPDDVTVATFLFLLIDGSILSYSVVEDALTKLISCCNDLDCRKVADALMNKLAISLGFKTWKEDGFVIMVRLQRMML